ASKRSPTRGRSASRGACRAGSSERRALVARRRVACATGCPAPAPLLPFMTPSQKRIFIVVTGVIAPTRFLAVAPALFDWDEALFSLGVRDYDVAQHHPHPPGYPVFIALAKGVHALGVSEFRSLQVVVLAGSFFLFPALVALAREIGFDFTTAVCGAAI